MPEQTERNEWEVVRTNSYACRRVVNGKRQEKIIRAHCPACAKAKILYMYGGEVDASGWQEQGMCGQFLRFADIRGPLGHVGVAR